MLVWLVFFFSPQFLFNLAEKWPVLMRVENCRSKQRLRASDDVLRAHVAAFNAATTFPLCLCWTLIHVGSFCQLWRMTFNIWIGGAHPWACTHPPRILVRGLYFLSHKHVLWLARFQNPQRGPKNIFDLMSAKGHRLTINTMSNVMLSYKAVQECVQSGSAMSHSGAKSDQRTLSSQNTGEDEELLTDGRLSSSLPLPLRSWRKDADVFFFFFSQLFRLQWKTNPEVAQVIIAHKKEMTPQNAAARRKQASGGMAGSFRQFGVSHAQRWESGRQNCLMWQNKDRNTRRESQNQDPERFMPPFYL